MLFRSQKSNLNFEKHFLITVYNEALRRNPKDPLNEWFDLSMLYFKHPETYKFIIENSDSILSNNLNEIGIKYLRYKPILVSLKSKGLIECNNFYDDSLKFKLHSEAVEVINNTEPLIKIKKS